MQTCKNVVNKLDCLNDTHNIQEVIFFLAEWQYCGSINHQYLFKKKKKKTRGGGGEGVRESKKIFLSILSAGNEDHLFKTTV